MKKVTENGDRGSNLATGDEGSVRSGPSPARKSAATADSSPNPFAILYGLSIALFLGGAGGWLFQSLGSPLPWLLGAVFFTMTAAFARLPVSIPNHFRNGMMVVLGVLVGSGFSPGILADIQRWTISIAAVLLYSVLLAVLAFLFFRHVAGYKKVDAIFAGLPGGLAAVIFIGAEAGADLRTLSVVHSMRIVVVCFAIPFWIRFSEGIVAGASLPVAVSGLGLSDALLLGFCGVAGYFVAVRARLPAPFLMGPLFFSAAVHIAGLTAAKPPGLLVMAAQIVVGSAIGCRFSGVPVRKVLGTVGLGFVATVWMVAAAFATAAGLHWWTGLPFNAMLLALAPGGLPEMTLIALSLDIDLALVVSHHLVRVLFINVAVPLLARKFLALQGPG